MSKATSVPTETLFCRRREVDAVNKQGVTKQGDEKRPSTTTATTSSCIAYSEAGDHTTPRSTPRSHDSGGSDDDDSELTRVTSRSSWTPALSVPRARLREIERDNRALLSRIDAARSGRRAHPPPPTHDPRLSSAAINRRRLEARIAEENQRIMRRLQRVKSCTDTSSPWTFSERRPLC